MGYFFVTSASRALVNINRDTVCFSVVGVINFKHRQSFAFRAITNVMDKFSMAVIKFYRNPKCGNCNDYSKNQHDALAFVESNTDKTDVKSYTFQHLEKPFKNLIQFNHTAIKSHVKTILRHILRKHLSFKNLIQHVAVSGRDVRCPALPPSGCALLSECHSQGAPVIF